MTLITNDTTLKKYIPNQFETVEGEDSLFTKIEPALEIAEKWIENWITPLNITQDTNILDMLKKICAYMAFQEAIPSLDLVLTPNGFGIVSNQNVAPASAERVTRLINSLIRSRNKCVALVLKLLHQVQQWHQTVPARFWKTTLFQNIEDTLPLINDTATDEFDEYRKIVTIIYANEHFYAEKVLSFDLLDKLKMHLTDGTLSVNERNLADMVRQHTYNNLICQKNGQKCNPMNSCVQIATFLKNNISDFPLWETSDVAELWLDPVYFRNKQENHGYFF